MRNCTGSQEVTFPQRSVAMTPKVKYSVFSSIFVPVTTTALVVPGAKIGMATVRLSLAVTTIDASPLPASRTEIGNRVCSPVMAPIQVTVGALASVQTGPGTATGGVSRGLSIGGIGPVSPPLVVPVVQLENAMWFVSS